MDKTYNIYESFFISASAGTGKTYLLIERLTTLILSRTSLNKILCITYTRAGIEEIRERLFAKMTNLVSNQDEANKYYDIVTQLNPSLYVSKEEFVEYISNILSDFILSPNEIRIVTIHSFCESILRKFSSILKIDPDFDILEDYTENMLIQKAYHACIDHLDDEKFKKSLSYIFGSISEHNLLLLLKAISKEYYKIRELFYHFPLVSDSMKYYCKLFDYPYKELQQDKNWTKEFLDATNFENLKLIYEMMSYGKSRTQKYREKILVFYNKYVNNSDIYEDMDIVNYCKSFFRSDMTSLLRIDYILTKDLVEKFPNIVTLLEDELFRIQEYIFHVSKYNLLKFTENLLLVLQKFLLLYQKEKGNNFHYNDIIFYTYQLLHIHPNKEQILYELNIEHVLLDEAQDTSALQWNIIQKLYEDFFSGGEGQNTLFIVGDEKQSIFSFQGANVNLFRENYKYFLLNFQSLGKEFILISKNESYRSGQNILDFVNDLFNSHKDILSSITKDSKLQHVSMRQDIESEVVIHKLFTLDNQNDEDTQEAENKNKNLTLNQVFAASLANQIDDMIKNSYVNDKNGRRKIKPSDIMILFRNRDSLYHNIKKELSVLSIPMNFREALNLKNSIAIYDLIVFAKFALNPHIDMFSAIIAKSPFIGISDSELYDVIHKYDSISLYEKLRRSGYVSNDIEKIIEHVLSYSPREFYEIVFSQFFSLFGTEEFYEQIQVLFEIICDYENNDSKLLTGFITWFELHDFRFNFSNTEEGVRLLTTHSSKGLEAPIVILANANIRESIPFYREFASQNYKIKESNYTSFFIWNVYNNYYNPIYGDICEKMNQEQSKEFFRLLYVALTRATHQLHIFGVGNKIVENSWYDYILRTMYQRS